MNVGKVASNSSDRASGIGYKPSLRAGSEISLRRSSEGQVYGDESGPLVGSSRPPATSKGPKSSPGSRRSEQCDTPEGSPSTEDARR